MNSFDKIIGYESIKIEITRICDVVKNGDKYKKLGVKLPNGLLLYGEPVSVKHYLLIALLMNVKESRLFAEKIYQMENLLNL